LLLSKKEVNWIIIFTSGVAFIVIIVFVDTQIAVVSDDGLAVPQIRRLLAFRPLDYPIAVMMVTVCLEFQFYSSCTLITNDIIY
jgi:hypothetical protein